MKPYKIRCEECNLERDPWKGWSYSRTEGTCTETNHKWKRVLPPAKERTDWYKQYEDERRWYSTQTKNTFRMRGESEGYYLLMVVKGPKEKMIGKTILWRMEEFPSDLRRCDPLRSEEKKSAPDA